MPLRDLCPPILWNYVRQRRYGEEVRFANRRYHVMQTDYSATPLHVGRYAEIFERVSRNDPHFSPELRRYRTYNICQAARWSLAAPGDFLWVGVSFGITPRTVFEFVDFGATGRTYHLVDPFNAPPGGVYNNDPDLVRQRIRATPASSFTALPRPRVSPPGLSRSRIAISAAATQRLHRYRCSMSG
jgi:hypothetical protein